MKKRQLLITYLVTIVLIYGLWYVLSLLLGSNLLPDPFLVLRQGISELDKGLFWSHVAASLFRILAGLFFGFILAVPIGLFLGSNERFDRLFAPLIYLGYPIPKIVLMPIIFVLFGLGDTGKIVLITMIIFFQLLITTRDSARKISMEVIYSLKSLGGNRWHFYRHVVWPISLPGIFTSLRIGTGTAVAVLFFVESIATRKGLGFYIIDAWGRADYPTMFVGIIALSCIGIILYEVFDLLEKKLCTWKNA
ncbi:MAG: ABC-type nitrate/sulfonate/bicarbonate transport system, permease component [Deltaproteobacteria bacterium]|nr:ABC-type nitrate/sulfonate/bicarbonate transport system, permease component [Deltaproteobacteria bacterium]